MTTEGSHSPADMALARRRNYNSIGRGSARVVADKEGSDATGGSDRCAEEEERRWKPERKKKSRWAGRCGGVVVRLLKDRGS